MEINSITTELDETAGDFLQTLGSFTQQQINIVPFEGSWTAGEVASHILRSASGVLNALNGPVAETERNPEQHVDMLRKVFLDFNTKMTSPDFVLPSPGPHNKDVLLQELTQTFAGIHQAVEVKDLLQTCTAFDVPGLGKLTGVELSNFIIVHTKRHAHQLKNIKKKLA
jgi:hypothetical protein